MGRLFDGFVAEPERHIVLPCRAQRQKGLESRALPDYHTLIGRRRHGMVDEAERFGAETVTIRRARLDDLPALIAIFAADTLGGHGDSADPAALPDYQAAFRRIEDSPNDALFVAELDGEVVGTFQTTLIVSLTGRGSANLTVEAVQTRNDMRGRGIGSAMMLFAIDEARRLGVRQVQLMSNATRSDAHRFYERLGFARSHAGFKMKLR